VTKVKGGPVEVEFSAEAARDVRASIDLDLMDFEVAAISEYDRQARANDLDQLLRVATKAVKDKVPSTEGHDIRSTVHVEDVIFARNLYQLLDYQPDRSGRGRRWSVRYGILGRSWRLERSIGTNDAYRTQESETALIHYWGLTQEEAKRASRKEARKSFLCVILRLDDRQVGVLYMDSREAGVFADAASDSKDPATKDEFAVSKGIEGLAAVLSLAKGVEKAMEQLRGAGTYLEFESKGHGA
jgi:hypothetical protein